MSEHELFSSAECEILKKYFGVKVKEEEEEKELERKKVNLEKTVKKIIDLKQIRKPRQRKLPAHLKNYYIPKYLRNLHKK